MITTSENWKDYSKDHTIYHIKAVLTSTDGTVLNLTDEDFMMGSVRIRDACSSTSSFDIGSVITNEFECSFNNTSGKFDGFDFRLATVEVQFGIVYEDESEEWIDRGVYTLDNPSSLGYTIQANAYDNMDKLNRIYIGKTLTDGVFVDITFPISSSDMAEALCNYCGVTFGSWMLDNDIELNEFEYNESTTCREVLAWILQINCGFGRMNPQGELECKWYNSDGYMEFDSLDGGIMSPWGSAEDADGGTMQPWSIVADINGGLGLNYLVNRVSRTTVASEDIKITGIRVYVPDTVEEFEFATVGTNGYILVIENNPFVTADNMNGIANAIYSVIGGTRFRPFDASIWGDPSIEAGDTIGIYDYLGRLYISYISNLSYPLNGLMDIECGAETVSDRENEYSNPQTSTIQSAVTAAYDYIAAKKISADYIRGGTLVLGGLANINGSISILSADGDEIGVWDKNGIVLNSANLGYRYTVPSDYIVIKQIIMAGTQLDPTNIEQYDFNGDGKVSALDYTYAKNHMGEAIGNARAVDVKISQEAPTSATDSVIEVDSGDGMGFSVNGQGDVKARVVEGRVVIGKMFAYGDQDDYENLDDGVTKDIVIKDANNVTRTLTFKGGILTNVSGA